MKSDKSKLYVLLDKEDYMLEYKFAPSILWQGLENAGWIVADEEEVNETTPFSKLINGKFVLDADRWNEYQECLEELYGKH